MGFLCAYDTLSWTFVPGVSVSAFHVPPVTPGQEQGLHRVSGPSEVAVADPARHLAGGAGARFRVAQGRVEGRPSPQPGMAVGGGHDPELRAAGELGGAHGDSEDDQAVGWL